jgi:hypothetical protein
MVGVLIIPIGLGRVRGEQGKGCVMASGRGATGNLIVAFPGVMASFAAVVKMSVMGKIHIASFPLHVFRRRQGDGSQWNAQLFT